ASVGTGPEVARRGTRGDGERPEHRSGDGGDAYRARPRIRHADGALMPPRREPMVMVKELCIDCAVCREVCPYTAVFFVPTKWKIALQVDQARCTGCGGP